MLSRVIHVVSKIRQNASGKWEFAIFLKMHEADRAVFSAPMFNSRADAVAEAEKSVVSITEILDQLFGVDPPEIINMGVVDENWDQFFSDLKTPVREKCYVVSDKTGMVH